MWLCLLRDRQLIDVKHLQNGLAKIPVFKIFRKILFQLQATDCIQSYNHIQQTETSFARHVQNLKTDKEEIPVPEQGRGVLRGSGVFLEIESCCLCFRSSLNM
ncbi:hypothetical protein KOW79_006370 [Hemibagrus wyckioides]|uniref:Uncharacterized protein n=1 Tax=Hemibagrus wyckioides TaxID=337641 RepID=A0A9D3NZI7_9TELE|nr:hypothetical protein KOW79_006370 [Hemibagrus wyckioides]